MSATPEVSNKEKALELRAKGMNVKDIAAELGVSKVSVYKYFEGSKPAGASAKAEFASDNLEMQLLRIENQALKAQLDVYKAECARLRGLLEE